jgi:hypothetical protein
MGVAGNLVRKRRAQAPFSPWTHEEHEEIAMVGRLQLWAAVVGTAALAVMVWSVTTGTAAASASTRLRSGAVHAQLASHVATGGNAVSSGISLKGSGVMAGIVGALAVFALAFLVVTFIRRRVTVVA